MDLRLHHRVVYEVDDLVAVEDVAESLLANARAIREAQDLLEGCLSGLVIEKIDIRVVELSQSSLREIFFATLLITFQEDLATEIPKVVERFMGHEVSADYDTLITVCALIVIFYTSDFVYRRVMDAASSKYIKRQLDGLVSEVSEQMGLPEEKVRNVLRERYGSSRLKSLATMASGFFRPSKRGNNAPIRVGSRRIDHKTVREFPSQVGDRKLAGETQRFFSNVEMKLIAQDLDWAGKGWAGIIERISPDRVPVQICRPVRTEQLYARRSVRADVVAIMTLQDDGSYAPSKYQVVRVYD